MRGTLTVIPDEVEEVAYVTKALYCSALVYVVSQIDSTEINWINKLAEARRTKPMGPIKLAAIN